MTEHDRMIEARHAEILQQLDNHKAVIDAVFLELQTIGDSIDQLTAIVERLVERPASNSSSSLSDDALYEEARATVVVAGNASTSLLQRRLGIGYSRAAALIDQLEDKGVIAPAGGAKPRRVLISADKPSANAE